MTQFVEIETATQRVLRGLGRPDPDDFEGPAAPAPSPQGGLIYLPWQGRLTLGDNPTPTSEYLWQEGAPTWVETGSLAVLRAAKTQAMSAACGDCISAGFLCAALGTPHLYPAKQLDQANLVASVTDSLLAGGDPDWNTPFWCCDDGGEWGFRLHTIAQIQQVGREGKAATLAAMSKNELLRQQISAASEEQLKSITW